MGPGWTVLFLLGMLSCQGVSSQQADCKVAQGMQDGRINDTMLLVSSQQPNQTKVMARFGTNEDDYGSAWCPNVSDPSPWIEVHLAKPTAVSGVQFQHPARGPQMRYPEMYMKTFRLLFQPSTGSELIEFNRNIPGIENKTATYRVMLHPVVVTSRIRIEPESFVKAPCFRFEVLGCDPKVFCPSGYCQNNGSCIGENVCKCQDGFFGEKCQYTAITVPRFDFRILRIVGNVVVTVSANLTIHGQVTLDAQHSALVIGRQSYVELLKGDRCLRNLDKCVSGFTNSLAIKFQQRPDVFVILSTGVEGGKKQGLSLYYQHGNLTCIVRSATKIWQIRHAYHVTLNTWQTFQMTWHPSLGLQLLVNGKVVASLVQHARTASSNPPGGLHIGSAVNVISVKVKDIQHVAVPLVQMEKLATPTLPPATTTPNATSVRTTPPTNSPTHCKVAQGMQDGRITDAMLLVSSQQPNQTKAMARFGTNEAHYGSAWCPNVSDPSPWIEVHLAKPTAVSGVQFQHPAYIRFAKYPETYMKTFTLLFQPALGSQELIEFNHNIPAIENKSHSYDVMLTPVIVTSRIRIQPEAFVTAPCFRFEVLGCDPKGLCGAGFCQNGGSCLGENVCDCPDGFYGAACQHTALHVPQYTLHFLKITNNVVMTLTYNITIHGSVTLEKTDSSAALVIGAGGQAHLPKGDNCLANLDACFSGFTFSMALRFHKQTSAVQILSSRSQDGSNSYGLRLIYAKGKLHCDLHTQTKVWRIQPSFSMTADVWHQIDVTWAPSLGLKLVAGGQLLASLVQPFPMTPTAANSGEMILGSQSNVDVFKIRHIRYVSLPLSEVTRFHSTAQKLRTEFKFLQIVNNVLITSSTNLTVHGDVTLSSTTGAPLGLTLSKGGYLEVTKPPPCLTGLGNCSTGFTYGLQLVLPDSLEKVYVLTSGGDKPGHTGLALFLQHGRLVCVVSTATKAWRVDVPLSTITTTTTITTQLHVSWSLSQGLTLDVNGHLVTSGPPTELKTPANQSQPLTIGSQVNTATLIVHRLTFFAGFLTDLQHLGLIVPTVKSEETTTTEPAMSTTTELGITTATDSPDTSEPLSTEQVSSTQFTEAPTTSETTSETHATTKMVTVMTYAGGEMTTESSLTSPVIDVEKSTPSSTDLCQASVQEVRFLSITGEKLLTSMSTMTAHGDVSLETSSHGTALVLDRQGEYVDMRTTGIPCVDDVTSCNTSFNFRLTLQLLQVDQSPNYLISSGGEDNEQSGVSLYYFNYRLYFWVKNGTDMWRSIFEQVLEEGRWYTIDASWSQAEGCDLYLDGVKVKATKFPVTPTPFKPQVSSLLIAKSPARNHTTLLKLLLLRTWTETVEELVNKSCDKELEIHNPTTPQVPTTTGTAQPPDCPERTVDAEKLTYNLTFLSVKDKHVTTPDLDLLMHGQPDVIAFSRSTCALLENRNQSLELNTLCVPCLANLPACTSGFTISMVVNFTQIDGEKRTYLLDSGGDTMQEAGIKLFYEKGNFKGMVQAGYSRWFLNVPQSVKVGRQYEVQLSWGRDQGVGLYVNQYTVDSSSNLTLPFVYANQTHALRVGGARKGDDADAKFMLCDLMLWTATRDVLVQKGMLPDSLTTPASTTTTTATRATTTSSPSTPLSHHWTLVNRTSSPSALISGELTLTIHGSVTWHQHGVQLQHSGEFLQVSGLEHHCLTQPHLCNQGFTVALEITRLELRENTVLLSTGAEKPDASGILLLYRFGHLQAVVTTSTKSWFLSIPREQLTLFRTHTLHLSWNHRLQLYIDKVLVAQTTTGILHSSSTSLSQTSLCVGKPVTSLTSVRPVHCTVTSLTVWQASVDILIQQGILSVLQTTPATTNLPGKTTVCVTSFSMATEQSSAAPSLPATAATVKTAVPIATTGSLPPSTAAPPTPQSHASTTPTSTTTATTTVRTTTIRVPSFQVEVQLTAKVDGQGSAFLLCSLVGSLPDGIQVRYEWHVQGVSKNLHITLPSSQAQLPVSDINERLLGREVTCTAKAQYVGSSVWTATKISNILKPYIMVSGSTHLTLIEGASGGNLSVHTNVPPHFLCGHGDGGRCNVYVTAMVSKSRDYKCSRSHIVIPQVVLATHSLSSAGNAPVCGLQVTAANWVKAIPLKVKATVDGLFDRDASREIQLQVKIVGKATKTVSLQTIKVLAKNRDRKSTCSSINDPHITTFDHIRYDNFLEGEFVLYRHQTLPYEVHALYRRCGNGRKHSPTCNCGVAVRSGDDVITLSACAAGKQEGTWERLLHHHHHHRHSRSSTAPIAVQIFKNGELTPGTTVRRIGCGQKYEVHLPTGTVVTVMSSYRTYINIWIRASSVDFEQTEGLCGTYDGHSTNDLTDSRGNVARHSKHPDTFSASWKATTSIFQGVAATSSLTSPTATYCSCVEGADAYCRPGLDIFRCDVTTTDKYDITSTLMRQAKTAHVTLRRVRRQAEIPTSTVPPLVTDGPEVTSFTNASAHAYCEEYLDNSTSVRQCQGLVSASSVQSSVQDCAFDLEATGQAAFARSHVDNVLAQCVDLAERDVTLWGDNSTGPPPEVLNVTRLCEEDCGPHGDCDKGTCACHDGYTGILCDVSSTTKPDVIPGPSDGAACDVRNSNCSEVAVYGINFVDTATLTCRYQFVEVSDSVAVLNVEGTNGTSRAAYVSMYHVVCPLPSPPRSAYVSVSNDGSVYSDQRYLHVVHDSVCHSCDVTTEGSATCHEKPLSCLMTSGCYGEGEKRPLFPCQLCDPLSSRHAWTQSSEPACTAQRLAASEPVSSSPSTVIALGVVCGVLVFALLVASVVIWRSRKARRSKFQKADMDGAILDTLQDSHRPALFGTRQFAVSNPAYHVDRL